MIPARFPVPTNLHLARAYYELGKIGARAVGAKRRWPYHPALQEELLALCGELSRYDPRLFEILVNFFRTGWDTLDWLRLRRAVLASPSPQVFGVIGDFLKTTAPDIELQNCFRFLLHNVAPVPTQFFYRLLYTPGSRLAARAMEQRLKEFERWGFLASERPIVEQATKQGAGHLTPQARRAMLQQLCAKKGRIRISDYIRALPHPVSRQQALLDLRSFKGLRRKGHGRGAEWLRK